MAARCELLHRGSEMSDRVYLNTAAEGLPLSAAAEAVLRYLDDKATGEPGRVAMFACHQRTREQAAQLFNVTADQIALLSSTTEVLNSIAHGIDWRPGDEVVFTSTEFPSNMFPWVTMAERFGVVPRIVAPRDGLIRTEDLLARISPRTRLVTVSQVSYATGQHIDPRPVWEHVAGTNTLLCVDATQAAGRVPVDGSAADFVVASAFKWLNSIHGSAILSVSPRAIAQGVHGPAGWFSTPTFYADDRLERFHPFTDARRFHAGMPNFDSVYALEAALKFHNQAPVADRRSQLEPLVSRLIAGLNEIGVPVLTPESPDDRAGIVAFSCAGADEAKARLRERGTFVHGDDGRLRAAIHWYNTPDDIDAYLRQLGEILPGL